MRSPGRAHVVQGLLCAALSDSRSPTWLNARHREAATPVPDAVILCCWGRAGQGCCTAGISVLSRCCSAWCWDLFQKWGVRRGL